ncbi:MAG: CtsR family transcriptional regulator [Bacillota bacterium]|nr:CtsR family transcriptional regulator [Bacillota bacterium]
MANLADQIEAYLVSLFESGDVYELEVQRVEIARFFACAPSQVTYVLATRFTPERGYLVYSRRGGGGFVRITRLAAQTQFLADMLEATGHPLTQTQAASYLDWMRREGLCSAREGDIVRAMIDRETLSLPLPGRDQVRSRLLRAACLVLLAGTVRNGGPEGPVGSDPEG